MIYFYPSDPLSLFTSRREELDTLEQFGLRRIGKTWLLIVEFQPIGNGYIDSLDGALSQLPSGQPSVDQAPFFNPT
ncbi:MAG: hypothetical protein PHQ40_14720 [Anaerolineaceae bacterium]|nr:hypothetical protein [Anaerolineaceae bacterium]